MSSPIGLLILLVISGQNQLISVTAERVIWPVLFYAQQAMKILWLGKSSTT
jgi:hypothetical protein